MTTRHQILKRMVAGRVVAVLRQLTGTEALALVPILVEEGIEAIEITLDSPGALETIAALRRELGDAALVGAGTVLDGTAAVQAVLAGADFLVSPGLVTDLIAAAHRYGKVAVPGAMSPTEVLAAAAAGADLVKVFPAGSLGPGYIKSLRGPLGHVPLMASGGVGPENAEAFLTAGVAVLGVGGSLTRRSLVVAGQWQEIRAVARAMRQVAFSGSRSAG